MRTDPGFHHRLAAQPIGKGVDGLRREVPGFCQELLGLFRSHQAGCKAGATGSKVSITLLSLIWE